MRRRNRSRKRSRSPEDFVQEYPENQPYREGLATTLSGQGDVLAQRGQWQAALDSYREALAIDPSSWQLLFQSALLQLVVDDKAAYRATCAICSSCTVTPTTRDWPSSLH